MAAVLIRCPDTGRAIATGIETDRFSFETLPDIESKLRCPACGKIHVWRRSDAWLEGSNISGAQPSASAASADFSR